ncbi:MAG: bifunctional phosphoribosylaminoimidazolecarboxamide formyltransferase/IMP cyclohydrolase [Rhizobiales bacterium]|nr:bifunctional phosphoribosylaminoimidazolecarboxamide formyltransferase/IMP cyclohydrolase [Hyphomicrobiales bacterium]
MSETPVKVTRALISVSDKTGIVDFASALAAMNIEIVSTGGTAKALRAAGLEVRDISDLTGFPEMMDGRIKTLHPKVHGGLLAVRGNPDHDQARADHDISAIDLVVINLYPFEETVAAGSDFATIIENIDIGGPAMIRSAAKNHASVTVITDPDDYASVLGELTELGGATSTGLRRNLAAKAFARTATYDSAIHTWFNQDAGDLLTPRIALHGKRGDLLRYGENPHQQAGFYQNGSTRHGVATARQIQGKALSYNNLNDTDAAFELVAEFDPADSAAVAIIKHANPCGVALADNLAQAYEKALQCDSTSAFGGIIATNRPLDARAAEAMIGIFTEVIIAPGANEEAIAIIAAKKNLRLLLTDGLPDPAAPGVFAKTVAGGLLVQNRDNGRIIASDLKIVTKRAPDARELVDMIFAFRIAKHVKSNAIVYVRDQASVGIGAGQMSRIDSSRIAVRKAEDAASGGEPATKGSVVASDAFFPFADGLITAIEAGATAVIQPGGSIRDDEVIKAADDAGVAMAFTGMRHFRH